MNVWLTSDTHLGITDERCAIMQRPTDYEYQFLANWKKQVGQDDLVIHLGDVCDQGNSVWLSMLDNLPGRKWLIRGNHDRNITDERFAVIFERIFPENAVLQMNLAGEPVSLSHYPHYGTAEYFHICGHIHSAWKYQKNMLNVGIDTHHFALMNAGKIPFYIKAITDFYDQDVWVAGLEANTAHNARGKAGYYFNEAVEVFTEVLE